jgi:hypothetical protein
MWESRPLTPLWAFTACYRDIFAFFHALFIIMVDKIIYLSILLIFINVTKISIITFQCITLPIVHVHCVHQLVTNESRDMHQAYCAGWIHGILAEYQFCVPVC